MASRQYVNAIPPYENIGGVNCAEVWEDVWEVVAVIGFDDFSNMPTMPLRLKPNDI